MATEQLDAIIASANTPGDVPDGVDGLDDIQDLAQDNIASGPSANSRHSKHQDKRAEAYPRLTEAPPQAAPRSPVLRLPTDPKSLNGKRLTYATLSRDRDMLESRKSR